MRFIVSQFLNITLFYRLLSFFKEGYVHKISGAVIVCFSDIQASDPAWYQILTANLTTEQQKALQEVMVLADQRKAAAESKRIEQSGGK